jgi:hypothetical protein
VRTPRNHLGIRANISEHRPKWTPPPLDGARGCSLLACNGRPHHLAPFGWPGCANRDRLGVERVGNRPPCLRIARQTPVGSALCASFALSASTKKKPQPSLAGAVRVSPMGGLEGRSNNAPRHWGFRPKRFFKKLFLKARPGPLIPPHRQDDALRGAIAATAGCVAV